MREKPAFTMVAVDFRTIYKRNVTLGRTETTINGV